MIDESICSQSGQSYDFGVLDGILSGLGVAAGVTCTPITALGIASGAQCTQQAVCCTNNTFVSLRYALVIRPWVIRTDARWFCFFFPCRTVLSTLPALLSTSTCEVDI
jgi:hypothetical protein